MNVSSRCVYVLAVCAAGSILFAAQAVPLFPAYSPTPDADPSLRHTVVVPMPIRLSVERTSDRLSVGFDLASARKVKIAVGKRMSIGVKYEIRVYAKGDVRPRSPGGVGYASIREPITASEPGFLNGRTFLNSVDRGGIPARESGTSLRRT